MMTKTKKTWKRGRKPKPPGEKQGERIAVYLTPEDARNMRADSDGAGISPGALLTGLWREWRQSREG